MRFSTRVAVFLVLCAGLLAGRFWFLTTRQPERSARHAVAALNGGEAAAAELRRFDELKNVVDLTCAGLAGAAFVLVVARYAREPRIVYHRPAPAAARLVLLPTLIGLGSAAGCKPYDKPEYESVDTAETAFLVPLEGGAGDGAKFQSEEYLSRRKVAAKRVQITHRWDKTGRGTTGEWLPTVRLIKVNRSPVTRQWTADKSSGTSDRDEAIWVESADSVGFSTGFTVTAFVAEDDAAKFLYWYPSGSLATVMDAEVRGRIQQAAAEGAAKYPLDDLRARKQEMIDAVRADVTTFFERRGITVTTVGMFGGMTYENPAIQKSIDDVFVAQQLKNVSLAKFEAQKKENERVQLEAQGLAAKTLTVAEAEAKAKVTAAEAEAQMIRLMSETLAGHDNPGLFAIRALALRQAEVEKWDGRYPNFVVSTGGGAGGAGQGFTPNFMIPVPGAAGEVRGHGEAAPVK
jgi:hypothetical protein